MTRRRISGNLRREKQHRAAVSRRRYDRAAASAGTCAARNRAGRL